MLEMISKILLGYYIVVAVALLVFLMWTYLDNRRQANCRGRINRNEDGQPPRTGVPDCIPEVPSDPDTRLPDNVVMFPRDN